MEGGSFFISLNKLNIISKNQTSQNERDQALGENPKISTTTALYSTNAAFYFVKLCKPLAVNQIILACGVHEEQ